MMCVQGVSALALTTEQGSVLCSSFLVHWHVHVKLQAAK